MTERAQPKPAGLRVTELLDISRQLFTGRVATTPEELNEAYRVRYKVYCLEERYFDPRNYRGELEIDVFDDRSQQTILTYQPTGAIVGGARLVLPAHDADPLEHLPLGSVCSPKLLDDEKNLPPNATAELSRLCLSRDLANEMAKAPPAGCDAKALREVTRHAKLWLMRGFVEMSVMRGITHWVAVMDPALISSLERLGVYFTRLGPPVEYYGLRQPCHDPMAKVLGRMKRERPDIWGVLTDEGRLHP